jgi:hypothetical protein
MPSAEYCCARFNAPATGGEEHHLTRVELSETEFLRRLRKRTEFGQPNSGYLEFKAQCYVKQHPYERA